MKSNLLFASAVAALLVSPDIRAQELEPRPPADSRQRLREERRNYFPEERPESARQQRGPFRQPGEAGPGQVAFRPGMMAGRGVMLEQVFMVLTPEQRESLRRVFEDNRDKIRDLEEKIRDARKTALEVSLGKDYNEGELRNKFEAAAKLDVELLLLRAKALSKVEPPLSQEQIERIKNPPPMGEMIRERFQQGPPSGERPFRPPGQPRQGPPIEPREGGELPPPARGDAGPAA